MQLETEVGVVTVTGLSAQQCVGEVLKLEPGPVITLLHGTVDWTVLERTLILGTAILTRVEVIMCNY